MWPEIDEVFDGSNPKPNGTRHQVSRRRTFEFSRAFKTLYVTCPLNQNQNKDLLKRPQRPNVYQRYQR